MNKKFIKYLEDNKITSKELERKSGLSSASIYYFKHGKRSIKQASFETVIKLSQGLDISLEELYLLA